MRFHGHFICFYKLRFRFKSKTIYKGNNVIQNIKCQIFFEFQAKLIGQELLGFGWLNLL